jgi:hypothetical protein
VMDNSCDIGKADSIVLYLVFTFALFSVAVASDSYVRDLGV